MPGRDRDRWARSGGADARADIVLNGGSFGPNGDIGFVTSPSGSEPSPSAGLGHGDDLPDGWVPERPRGGISAQGPGNERRPRQRGAGGNRLTPSASRSPRRISCCLSYTFTNNTGALPGRPPVPPVHRRGHRPQLSPTSPRPSTIRVLGLRQQPHILPDRRPRRSARSSPTWGPACSATSTNSPAPAAQAPATCRSRRASATGPWRVGQSVTFDVLLADDGSSLSTFSDHPAPTRIYHRRHIDVLRGHARRLRRPRAVVGDRPDDDRPRLSGLACWSRGGFGPRVRAQACTKSQ